jgi:hypothetical protein
MVTCIIGRRSVRPAERRVLEQVARHPRPAEHASDQAAALEIDLTGKRTCEVEIPYLVAAWELSRIGSSAPVDST